MHETTKHISLDLIDDPKIAMRSDVDADEIDELKASMAKDGLLQPIVVRTVGERFEIVAGHRRTRAARLLQWPMIEAKVVVADDNLTLALRLTENLQRHNVDPVDEACFIAESMTANNLSVEQVCEILGRSKAWVEERLEVFSMPDYLQIPLKQKKIPLGAALWIGRIENEETKRQYATWAAVNGVSVAGAKMWYENLKATNFVMPTTEVEIRDDGGQVQQIRKVITCAACGNDCYLDEANSVWVHSKCPS